MRQICKTRFSSRVLSSFCLLLALFMLLIGASLAWFIDMMRVTPPEDFFASSIASYFAGGDGKTPQTAYRIEEPVHLYNLAWLQNMGQFNRPDDPIKTYYFEIADSAHGPIVLDMAGKLTGANGIQTGAIPPIGTNQYPFQGVIDGKGSIVKNLWVSTHHDDWQEHPATMEVYQSTHVGLFGAVDGGATITNFNVDKIEITMHFSATVGIFCGYANANISDIGVYNGILDFRSSGLEATSEVTLLGELGENVIWGDMPAIGGGEGDGSGSGDGAGGEIIVDPNNIYLVAKNETHTQFSGLGTNQFLAVHNTIPGTAFFVGDLDTSSRPNGNMGLWDFTGGSAQTFVANTPEKEKILEAYEWYASNQAIVIAPDSAPSLSNLVSVTYTEKDGDGNTVTKTVKVPANAVWFKPQQAGTAALAFTKYRNKERYYYMSVYRYKRSKTTNTLTLDAEFKHAMPKSLTNGHVAYFEQEIIVAAKDADFEYEYAIGAPSSNHDGGSVGFVMMMLAGTNIEGGDTPGTGGGGSDTVNCVISDLDYIVASDVNVGAADYTFHTVLFTLSGTTASAGKITYLAWSDGKVYYHIDPTALGLVVRDVAANGVGASSATNDEVEFADRQDTASSSGG